MKNVSKTNLGCISRRHFGALVGSAATAALLLSQPSRAAAQQVLAARKLGSGVAAHAVDKGVFAWQLASGAKYLIVYTSSGELYAHKMLRGFTVSTPWRLGAIPWHESQLRQLVMDPARGYIYAVRGSGEVTSYPVIMGSNRDPSSIGPEQPVRVPGPVAAGPQDVGIVLVGDRVIVMRSDGATGFHRIESEGRWSAGASMAADSYRPVANNAHDKWVLPICGDRIGVLTSRGGLFVHGYDFQRDAVLPPARANTEQPIATNAQDRFVTADGTIIYVITNAGDVYGHSVEC